MKKNSRYLLLLLYVLLSVCCTRAETELAQSDKAEVALCCNVKKTKSSVLPGEDEILDYSVFFYRDGTLYAEASGKGGAPTSISLQGGCSYDVFAFANAGRIFAPRTKQEMLSYRFCISYFAQISSGGLPMAWHREDAIVPQAGKRNVLEIGFERMVAKYEVRIEKNLTHCDFTVTGAYLRQCALDITPFAAGSIPLDVGDGDEAEQEEDLDLLNGSGSVVFYTLENDQGRLLEGNADPWKKTPSNVGEGGDKCTYLEISGILSMPGASADMTYRMYLGKDNCSDFSVVRNTESYLTLKLSDKTTFGADWKIEKSYTRDYRNIYFDGGVAFLNQGSEWTQIESFELDPPDMDVRITTGTAIPALEWKMEDGKLYMRSGYLGQEALSTWINVESWDSEIQEEATVVVRSDPKVIAGLKISQPHYVGQWGTVDFSAVDISSSKSLYYSTGGNLWTISSPTKYPIIMYTYDENNVLVHYLNNPIGKCHMHAVAAGQNGGATIRHGSSYTSIKGEIGTPVLTLKESGMLILTEEGNSNSIAGRPYDASMDFCLTSPQGAPLSLESFAVPQEMIGYKNFNSPYGEIIGNITGGFKVIPSSASDVAWFSMDAAQLLEAGQDPQNCILRIFFRGQGRVEPGKNANKSGVEVRIGSSVFNADVELRRL